MSDDFFQKLDAKLAAEKSANEAKEADQKEEIEFVRKAIPRLKQIADVYEGYLTSKGIANKITVKDLHIIFEIDNRNGYNRALSAGHDYIDNYFSLINYFVNDDGKNYNSVYGKYKSSTWNDDIYEAALKKVIEDFVYYADRHGGSGAKS